MKKIQLMAAALAIGGLLSLSSCLKKDFDSPPDTSKNDPNLPVNMSIAQLKQKLGTSGAATRIDSAWTIYGIVTADDRSGNLYKQINIEDSTSGIVILIDANSLYTKYPVGRKVYVNLQGLYFGFYGGLPQIGLTDASGRMSQIPGTAVDKFIIRADFPHPVVTDTFNLSQISAVNNSLLNRLITVRDVEFEDAELGKTYAEDPNTATQSGTDRYIHSCSGTASVNVRTSNYANFQNVKLPGGKGTITALYTVYNGKVQLIIRDTSDVKFYDVRCDGSTGAYVFKEDFNSAVSGDINLPGWINFPQAGTQKWKFSNSGSTSNPYARISAFSTGEASVISWLVTPNIDLSGVTSPTLTFRTLSGFDNGATLEVFYSTDFNGDVNTATWTPLPAAVNHNPNGFGGVPWTPSGILTLPVAAKVAIAFKYTGSDGGANPRNTTYELDDVKISGN